MLLALFSLNTVVEEARGEGKQKQRRATALWWELLFRASRLSVEAVALWRHCSSSPLEAHTSSVLFN